MYMSLKHEGKTKHTRISAGQTCFGPEEFGLKEKAFDLRACVLSFRSAVLLLDDGTQKLLRTC